MINGPTSDFYKKITISFHFLCKTFYVKAFYAGKMWHVVQCNTFTWLHASHLKDIIPLYGNMHEGRKYKNAIRVVIICIRTKNTLVFYAIIKRCFCFFALPLCYKPSELNHFKTDIVGVHDKCNFYDFNILICVTFVYFLWKISNIREILFDYKIIKIFGLTFFWFQKKYLETMT